jgi:hypothetical protein
METGSTKPVLVRRSTAADFAALARLASLSGRQAPRGPFLIAEVGGKLVAAASLDVPAMLLADPAHETANIRALLFKWGANLRRTASRVESLAA